MGRLSYKIKASTLKIVLLLLPFFELYSINLFIESDYLAGIFYAIDRILAVMRWGITAWIIVDTIFAKRRVGVITKMVAVYSVLRIVACCFNGSMFVGIIIGNVTNLGFSLLIEKILMKKPYEFINLARILFGITCFLGVVTTFGFPYGFLGASDKAKAIYFFGSKNSGFYYYILFLFFGVLYSFIDLNKQYRKVVTVYSAIFCIASIVTSSANSLICVLLLTVYLLGFSIVESNTRVFEPRKVILIIIILGVVFVSGKEISLINSIVEFFGRNLTFTGRDYIWASSIRDFKDHVLWGCGVDYSVLLPNGTVANHAHNFFLDNLVKYGAIEFCSLIALVLMVGRIIKKKTEKRIKVFYSIILFVVLLHSLMDDNSIYFLCIIFITMEFIGEQNKNNKFTWNIIEKEI